MNRIWRTRLAATAAVVVLLQVAATPRARSDGWEGTPQQAFLDSPIVRKFQCTTCHSVTDQGGTVGPVLNLVGLRRSEAWLRRWLRDPNAVKQGTKMPKFPFTDEEFEMAVGYLTKMTRDLRTREILATGMSGVEKGRALFEDYDCRACHRIGDQGRFVGPDLTWVGARKPAAWERIWLRDPPGFKPGTFMPDFHIPEEGVRHLAAYLHTLQGEKNDEGRDWEFMINFTIDNDAKQRGEMVFKRLACWSCHGERGRGGVANPNAAAGHETVPGLKGVRDEYELESFAAWIEKRTTVPATSPDAVPQPYACPAYPGAVDQQDLNDLFAYVSGLAPRKSRWKIN